MDYDIRVFDEALPRDAYLRLEKALGAIDAPTSRTHWIDARSRPDNVVELVIDALGRVARVGDWLVGTEWWVRHERSTSAKPMHFDRDEALAARGEHVHPRLASILYLGSVGGRTLITGERCDRTGRVLRAEGSPARFAVAPRDNRYLVFDGTLYHGVLPAKSEGDPRRLTLLVNFWDRPLSDASARKTTTRALGLRRAREPIPIAERTPARPAVARVAQKPSCHGPSTSG